jgi:hypothetical protein
LPGDDGRKLKFVERVAKGGLKNYALPMGEIPEGFQTDGGQLILSRYPIVAKDFLQLTALGHYSDPNGIQYAKIRPKSGQFTHFFNIQLDKTPFDADEVDYLYFIDHRALQLAEALLFIESKGPYPKGEVVLVAGSFNIDANIPNQNKTGSFVHQMLDESRFYKLIAERKTDVPFQYN